MQKLGLGFIVAAILVIAGFAVDLMTSSRSRTEGEIEQRRHNNIRRELPEDDNAVDPDIAKLLDINVDDKDLLTPEERRAQNDGVDYVYEVKPGDTLDDLARKFFGDSSKKPLLFRANPDLVPGGFLSSGTKLVIPFSER